jgi:predicted permease|tara:strand:+ start:42 stop:965 length:924 start_codon:yes stop_codon:yes gene_type:complete
MFQVFLGLTPFIGITLIGFFLGKIKIFDLQKAKIFNLFSFYIAVPALIVKLVALSDIGEIDLTQISSYFLMQLTSGIIAFLLTKNIFRRSTPESIIWSLTVALSNHVILVLPIAEIFFGGSTVTQISSIILMDSVILLSVISFFLELTVKKKIKLIQFLKNLILNPMILAILIGLFIRISNINIDETPFEYILSRLAACVMPVGLFAIGIILSFYTRELFNKLTISISILKLIISPIILLFFGYTFFNLSNPIEIAGALLVSIGPCGATAIVMCSAYNVSPQNIIKAIFISTFASIFTFLFTINLLN